MHYGKVFEAGLIRALGEVFHYQVAHSSIETDTEEKVDFTVAGNSLPFPIEVQVTGQSDDGDKLTTFLRRAWFRNTAAPRLYVVSDNCQESIVVAQAMHRAFWRELSGIVKPKASYALWVDENGFYSLHDPKILARDLLLKSRAKTANSLRRRGRVIDVRRGLIVIARAGKKFFARLSSVVKGPANRFTSRKRIESIKKGKQIYVTFLPVERGRAEAIKLCKDTARRQQEKAAD
jgi:hypothetical protein